MADRVLILGGTEEARLLAAALAEQGAVEPVTALAGRTLDPAPVAGAVRVGGFGGPAGLAAHLRDEGYAALVDATHPFARQISAHAAAAADAAGVPRLALVRPGWTAQPGDRWIAVADEAEAANAVAALGLADGACVFLALGRQRIRAFAGASDLRFLLRTVDPVEPPWPGCRVVVARGPFDRDSERALLTRERIAAIVCRDSGGESGAAKLAAARALGLPVVMIRRPDPPEPPVAVSVDEAMAWLAALRPRREPINREAVMSPQDPHAASAFRAIGAIDYTVVFVRDMAAMRRFYEGVLGFPLLRELSAGWIEYRVGPNTLALATPSRTAADAPVPPGSAALQLAFKVPVADVDRCADELLRQGVALQSPPTDQPFGHRTLFFRDPDGNLLEVFADI